MFRDIVSNEEVKSFLKAELKIKKDRGAYIFYGEDEGLLNKFALSYAKSLNCKNTEDDFCDVCESCMKINSKTYADLEILEDENGIKIDAIREMSKLASIATYEGGARIFILRGAEKLKKEGANALLKLIEEPEKDNYFILLSKNLNLLPTIKSRCTILKIKNRTPEELGVTHDEFKFFLGKGDIIEEYKKYNFDIKEGYSYPHMYSDMEKYLKLQGEDKTSEIKKEILDLKIKIYKGLHDLYQNIEYIDVADRISIAENIANVTKNNREFVLEILDYISYFIKDFDKLEECILTKNKIKSNVNIKLLLRVFMLEL